MNKRDFIKAILVGGALPMTMVASGDRSRYLNGFKEAINDGVPLGDVVEMPWGYMCNTCGDVLLHLTRLHEIPHIGYVDVICGRCKRAWRLRPRTVDSEEIPYAPVPSD